MAETLRRLASLGNALSQNEIESKTVFPCRFKEGTSEDADKSIEFDVLQSSPIAKCETQADIQSKAATVSNFPDFTLVNGREVVVWFAYQNAVANPTLNINNTGDVEIVVDGLNDELEIPVELWKAESFVRFKYVSVTIGTTTISKWILGASTSSIYDALKDFSGVTPITQEEYDALPEEEKMADKLYLIQNPSDGGLIAITDDVQAGNMNAITSNAVNNALTDYYKKEEIDEFNTYSTEEVVIGKYMGKPLYRIMKELACPRIPNERDQSYSVSVAHNIENVDKMFVNLTKSIVSPGGYINSTENVNNWILARVTNTTLTLSCAAQNNISAGTQLFCLEYTKATD